MVNSLGTKPDDHEIKDIEYHKLSTYELARKIALESDLKAIEILWCQRKFPDHEIGQLCTCEDLVLKYCCKDQKEGLENTDEVRLLTEKKITNIPNQPNKQNSGATSKREVDCRNTYRAFISFIDRWVANNTESSYIEREALETSSFINMVKKRYNFATLDIKVKHLPSSRYTWKVNGGEIPSLWIPRIISGRNRGKWLDSIIYDPDPFHSGNRERLQSVIN